MGRVLGSPDRVRRGERAASGNAVHRKQPGWEQMVPQTAGAGASSRHMLRAATATALGPPPPPSQSLGRRRSVSVLLLFLLSSSRAGLTS